MIDTVWDLLLVILVSSIALCLVIFVAATCAMTLIKTKRAADYALRDQEIEYEKSKRENNLS